MNIARSRWQRIMAIIIVLGCCGSLLRAGISYDAAQGVLRVIDYPSDWPCTPERLYAMDQANGWGKVTYEAASDTYTVDADLWIGDNDNTDTFFQLGRADHPKEILVVKGNVVAYPYWVAGRNAEGWHDNPRSNRLTLGNATNSAITATLKIFSEKGREHALCTGVVPEGSNRLNTSCAGGQLYVHHSTITAAIQDEAHALGFAGHERMMPLYVYVAYSGQRHVLDQAVFSWMAGYMTYGFIGAISNTVFENGGIALSDCGIAPLIAKAEYTGLTLRNLKTAVRDNGSLDYTLVDCVFTNNDCNWDLLSSSKGLTCIDCTWSPPRQGDGYRAGDNPQTKKRQYPAFISRRHIIVSVADESGKPVSNAVVEISAEQPGTNLIERAKSYTDSSGKTPGWGRIGAILLTETIKQATDIPNQPKVSEFSYSLKVTAPGCQTVMVASIRPAVSWQIIPVVIKK